MSISDIKAERKYMLKCALLYLITSILCALFGGIYELFSHGVYSFFMIYAFAYPLVLGALPYLVLGLVGKTISLYYLGHQIYSLGIATLTLGSIVKGVLDIYGTTNILTHFYWWIGGALVLAGVLVLSVKMRKRI